MGSDAMIFVFWMLSFKPFFFTLLFYFHQEAFLFFFNFCHKDSVICISEVIDISPGNLNSSLCFKQPGILHDACAYKLNKQGDNIQPWCTPFPNWSQSVVSCPVLPIASWPAYRFLRRQVRWSGIPISLRIFHSLLWSTQSYMKLNLNLQNFNFSQQKSTDTIMLYVLPVSFDWKSFTPRICS